MNIPARQKAKLDKATSTMLNLGALPEGYKRPETTPRKDKNRRFRIVGDRTGRKMVVEVNE